jgi:hypothetical protein
MDSSSVKTCATVCIWAELYELNFGGSKTCVELCGLKNGLKWKKKMWAEMCTVKCYVGWIDKNKLPKRK